MRAFLKVFLFGPTFGLFFFFLNVYIGKFSVEGKTILTLYEKKSR